MKEKRQPLLLLLLVLFCSVALSGPASAEGLLSGLQIMRGVNARPRGGDAQMRMRLVLKDARRGTHTRQVEMQRKALATGYRTIYRISGPQHLAGISLLLGEDRELNGMWMYFPSSDHLVRVASRGFSALASDFSCEDLRAHFPLHDFNFKTLGREEAQGRTYWRVEMRPRTETLSRELGYSYAIGWILSDAWVITKAEYYDSQGKHFKTFQADQLEKISNVWTVRHYTMVNHRARHESEVYVDAVQYQMRLPKDRFEPNILRAR
jgi:hypothetical protein